MTSLTVCGSKISVCKNKSVLDKPIAIVDGEKRTDLGYLNSVSFSAVSALSTSVYLQILELFDNVSQIYETPSGLVFQPHQGKEGSDKSVYTSTMLSKEKTLKKVALIRTQKIASFKDEIKLLTELSGCQIVDAPKILYETSGFLFAIRTFYQCDGRQFAANTQHSRAHRWRVNDHIQKAVRQIHKWEILHRDIKPENVLIDFEEIEGETWPIAKLSDFGFAIKAMETGELKGSALFCPPEVLQSPGIMNQGTDLWSLGVTTFNILNNCLPFPDTNDRNDIKNRTQKTIDKAIKKYSENYTTERLAIQKRLLQIDPKKRGFPDGF